MNRLRQTWLLTLVLALPCLGRGSDPAWSADLLSRLLAAPGPAPLPAPVAPRADEGVVLRSYALRQVRLTDEASFQAVEVLRRLLPAGSILNVDRLGNIVHLLASAPTQAAVSEYLAAVDRPAAPAVSRELPAEIEQALARMAEVSAEAAAALESVGALGREVDRRLAPPPALAFASGLAAPVPAAAGLGLLLLAGWAGLRIRRRAGPGLAPPAPHSAELAVAPAASPVRTEVIRDELIAFMQQVAGRLQSEQTRQREMTETLLSRQLELADVRLQIGDLMEERRQMLADSRGLVAAAAERFDATAGRLSADHERVRQLVAELQSTLNELDQTRDQLGERQAEVQAVRGQLDHERAKIAALSLLLEEGAAGLRTSSPSAETAPLSLPCPTKIQSPPPEVPPRPNVRFLPPPGRS